MSRVQVEFCPACGMRLFDCGLKFEPLYCGACQAHRPRYAEQPRGDDGGWSDTYEDYSPHPDRCGGL